MIWVITFLVSTINRIDWIQKRYDPKEVIYMGDESSIQ